MGQTKRPLPVGRAFPHAIGEKEDKKKRGDSDSILSITTMRGSHAASLPLQTRLLLATFSTRKPASALMLTTAVQLSSTLAV